MKKKENISINEKLFELSFDKFFEIMKSKAFFAGLTEERKEEKLKEIYTLNGGKINEVDIEFKQVIESKSNKRDTKKSNSKKRIADSDVE